MFNISDTKKIITTVLARYQEVFYNKEQTCSDVASFLLLGLGHVEAFGPNKDLLRVIKMTHYGVSIMASVLDFAL